MRLFSAIGAACLLITGCSTFTANYNVALKSVERPAKAIEKYGETKITTQEAEGTSGYIFEDELIQSAWVFGDTQVVIMLKNKTDHSIKIIWDEAVYTGVNGISQRVTHSGVKYINRNDSQPPTTIIRNGAIEDIIVPTDNISFSSGKYGGWQTAPLLASTANTKEAMEEIASKYKDKKIQILLPLQIEDVVNEYLFVFFIKGYTVK